MAGRSRRPKLKNKEELIEYLGEHKDSELPFSEEVWKVAIEKTSDKERQFKTMVTTDFEGNIKTKKIPNGAVNPVSKYFQLLALPNFKKMAKNEAIDNKTNSTTKNSDYDIDDILEELDDDTEENTFIKELMTIYFSNLTGDNMKFVIDRLSDYYTNYEFNEGSDKFLVVSAVSDELTLRELYRERVKGKDNEATIDKVKKGYLATLDGLKLLKRQGGKLDEGKNKFTIMLDELEKAGDLSKYKIEVYEQDQIDELVDDTRRSIIKAFGDG